MKNELRVALIGTGYIGRAHAIAYSAANNIFPGISTLKKVMAVDSNKDLGERFSQRFGFAEFETSWNAAIDRPDIDIIAIATPNNTHRDIALAALSAGKHVYCEKPLSANLEDAEAMATAARESCSVTMVGYNYRCNPMLKLASKIISEGTIGKPRFFRGINDEGYLADPETEFSWRCDGRKAGLGVSADLLPHLIQLAMFLVGKVKAVTGFNKIVVENRRSANGAQPVENEDVSSAIVEFENGAHGELSSSRVSWGRTNRLAFEIQGESGAILFDQERLNELQVFVKSDSEIGGFSKIQSGPAHPPYSSFVQSAGHQIGFNDLKTVEVCEFLQAIAEREKSPCSFEDAVQIERVVHAISQSSQDKKPKIV